MHTHLTKVITEARLEKGTCGFRQRLTASLQCMDAGFKIGSYCWCVTTDLFGLENFFSFLLFFLLLLLLLLLLFFYLFLNQWSNLVSYGFGLNQFFFFLFFFLFHLSLHLQFRHPYHGICYPVCFLLINIVGLADGEFGLDHRRTSRTTTIAWADRFALYN